MSLPTNFLSVDPGVNALIQALDEPRQDAAYYAIELCQQQIREMIGAPNPKPVLAIKDGLGDLLVDALSLSPDYAQAKRWVQDRMEGKRTRLPRYAGAAVYAACCGLFDAGACGRAMSRQLAGWRPQDIQYECRSQLANVSNWVHKPSYWRDLPRLREAARHIALVRQKVRPGTSSGA